MSVVWSLTVCVCVALADCGFIYRSQLSPNGTFTSPNYPGFYPRNTECHYLFYGLDNERVHITFRHFDVEGMTRSVRYWLPSRVASHRPTDPPTTPLLTISIGPSPQTVALHLYPHPRFWLQKFLRRYRNDLLVFIIIIHLSAFKSHFVTLKVHRDVASFSSTVCNTAGVLGYPHVNQYNTINNNDKRVSFYVT